MSNTNANYVKNKYKLGQIQKKYIKYKYKLCQKEIKSMSNTNTGKIQIQEKLQFIRMPSRC